MMQYECAFSPSPSLRWDAAWVWKARHVLDGVLTHVGGDYVDEDVNFRGGNVIL